MQTKIGTKLTIQTAYNNKSTDIKLEKTWKMRKLSLCPLDYVKEKAIKA
jgi:hypothetical protein